MFHYVPKPIVNQSEHVVLTPLVGVKDAHVRMVRKVNVKTPWGGEVIVTLDPVEHRVLCECVVLRLIEMDENGMFVLSSRGASLLEEFGESSTYTFMNADGDVMEIGEYEMLLLQTAAYVEDGVKGIGNSDEVECLKRLEQLAFVVTRNNGGTFDYYLTKTGIDFLIDEGYLLG
jgi:hypothetical protein